MSPELCARGEAGGRPRAVAGLSPGSTGKRFPRRGGGGPEQGPPSPRLQPGAGSPSFGAGALPPRCRPPRSPGPPGTLREEPPAAVTRQGGSGGAWRPCGEGGNASALSSAPAAPGGSTVERGRCGVGRDPRRVGRPQGPCASGPQSEAPGG